ncbi:hypothetical protein EXIGLDRAFT_760932 [Exidia glandulosa HHB12029]|uniref:Uncharacterized protein n=1 Tax=Exidia glandulosa HHB12029 TaxID=1314781 RepID=A0A165NSQ5_EXIGL|nr:hypothetical protein EXIGLDRAFT_760932 [Exidia glandulosa HHB12029]
MLSFLAIIALSAAVVHSAPFTEYEYWKISHPGVLVTTEINWQGAKRYFPDVLHSSGSGCISILAYSDVANKVSSFGPDIGAECWLYTDDGCVSGPNSQPFGPIFNPGVSDMTAWTNSMYLNNQTGENALRNFNDKVASFRCINPATNPKDTALRA